MKVLTPRRRSTRCVLVLAVATLGFGACSHEVPEATFQHSLRFPEYVEPPDRAPWDTLARPPELNPEEPIPPQIAPKDAQVTARVDVLPYETGGVLYARVAVRSATGKPVSAGPLCLLGLRMWRSGNPLPVWTSEREPPLCANRPAPTDLTSDRPGAPNTPQRFDVRQILGDSLPGGRYEFTALVRLRSDTLEVHAGQATLSGDTLPPLKGEEALRQLRYRADTRVEGVAPTRLRTRVAVTNAGSRRVQLEFGECSTRLRAYRTAERRELPSWDDRRTEELCLLSLSVRILEPGEAFERRIADIPVPEFLGDSLREGRYFFNASLEWHRRPAPGGGRLHGDSVHLPAGSADLVRRQAPLPAAQQLGPWRLAAQSEVVSTQPQRLLTTLTVTNTGTVAALWSASECARLTAVADRAARDRPYLYPKNRHDVPTWSPRGCMLPLRPLRLGPGESHTFGARVGAHTILGERLPAGRYYFLLSVPVQMPDRTFEQVLLAAGDARIRR